MKKYFLLSVLFCCGSMVWGQWANIPEKSLLIAPNAYPIESFSDSLKNTFLHFGTFPASNQTITGYDYSDFIKKMDKDGFVSFKTDTKNSPFIYTSLPVPLTNTNPIPAPKQIVDKKGGIYEIGVSLIQKDSLIYQLTLLHLNKNGDTTFAKKIIPKDLTAYGFYPWFDLLLSPSGNLTVVYVVRKPERGIGTPLYGNKFDENGNALWGTNGVILMDYINPTKVKAVLTAKEQLIISNNNGTPYLQKIDTDGKILWGNNATVGNSYGIILNRLGGETAGFFIDKDDNIYTIVRDNSSAVNYFAQKVLPDGTFFWSGNGKLLATAIDLGAAGTFIAKQYFFNPKRNEMFFEYYNISSPKNNATFEVLLQKVDLEGNPLWQSLVKLIDQVPANFDISLPNTLLDLGNYFLDDAGNFYYSVVYLNNSLNTFTDFSRGFRQLLFSAKVATDGTILWKDVPTTIGYLNDFRFMPDSTGGMQTLTIEGNKFDLRTDNYLQFIDKDTLTIKLKKFDKTNTKIFDKTILKTTNDYLTIPNYNIVPSHETNGFFIVWKSPSQPYQQASVRQQLFAQKITGDGNVAWTTPKLLANLLGNNRKYGSFSSTQHPDSGFITFFTSADQLSSVFNYSIFYDLYAQRLTENGNFVEMNLQSSTSVACQNDKIQVNISKDGTFDSTNVFKVLLSDENGSFANAQALAQSAILPISVQLKPDQKVGNFKLKVVSTSPIIESSNVSDLKINALPTAILSSAASIYRYDSTKISVVLAGEVPFKFKLWNDKDVQITNNSYQIYIKPTATASYTLKSLSDKNCSNGTSNSIQILFLEPLATSPNEIIQLKVYPNPTTSSIQIDYPATAGQTFDCQIFDLGGKLMQESSEKTNSTGNNSISVALQDLPTGIYLLKMQVGEKQFQRKIVLQK